MSLSLKIDNSIRKWASMTHMSYFEFQKRIFVYIGIIPVLLVYLFLRILPILKNFLFSFFYSTVVNPMAKFAGFANYKELFTDPLFLYH